MRFSLLEHHDPDRIDWGHPFWRKVAPEALSGCWLWMGNVIHGYGMVSDYVDGHSRHQRAHRVAFALCGGNAGRLLRHKCDVKACVNPAHLEPGTHADNAADQVSRGKSLKGSKHNMAILDEEKVVQIVKARRAGQLVRDIARDFGVSETTISVVSRRLIWRHVDV